MPNADRPISQACGGENAGGETCSTASIPVGKAVTARRLRCGMERLIGDDATVPGDRSRASEAVSGQVAEMAILGTLLQHGVLARIDDLPDGLGDCRWSPIAGMAAHQRCQVVQAFHLTDRLIRPGVPGEVEIDSRDAPVAQCRCDPPVAPAPRCRVDQAAVDADKLAELDAGATGPLAERGGPD